MSRNNLILVVRKRFAQHSEYYVVGDVNADTGWDRRAARACIASGEARRARSRAHALVRAHDLQKKTETEYGVRELSV